jgi:hypothetical protein
MWYSRGVALNDDGRAAFVGLPERLTAKIRFPDASLYWYHPHIREAYGLDMGLYGNLVVVPAEEDYCPPVNRGVLPDKMPLCRPTSRRWLATNVGDCVVVDFDAAHGCMTSQPVAVAAILDGIATDAAPRPVRDRDRCVPGPHFVVLAMKRAVELFALEVRSSRSTLVEETWQTRSEPEELFISVAATHWEMVVTRQHRAARLTIRGPETRATTVPIPQNAEFFGIQFSVGTFMPGLPPDRLVDQTVTLPEATGTSFRLGGSAWEFPGPDTADVFVDRLVRAGLLVHDPIVAAALQGDVEGFSTRSLERRIARATGLSRGAIGRIRRAERAVELLSRGVPARDVARRAGYADQPHLTRSLKRFVGQTPSQITGPAPGR